MNKKILLITLIGLCYAPSSGSEVRNLTQTESRPATIEYKTLPIDDLTFFLKVYFRTKKFALYSDEEKRLDRSGEKYRQKVKTAKYLLEDLFKDINNSFPLTLSDQAFETLAEQVKQDFNRFYRLQYEYIKQNPSLSAPIIPLALFAAMQSDNADPILFTKLDLIQIGKIAANAKPSIHPDNRAILNLGIEALKKKLEILRESGSAHPYMPVHIIYTMISEVADKLDETELASQALELAKSLAPTDEDKQYIEEKLNQSKDTLIESCVTPSSKPEVRNLTQIADRSETIEYKTLPIDDLASQLQVNSRAINLPSDSDEEKEIKERAAQEAFSDTMHLFKDINNSFPLTLSDQTFQTLIEQVKQDFNRLYRLQYEYMRQSPILFGEAPIIPLALFAAMQSDSADPILFNRLDLLQIGKIIANARPSINPDNRAILNLGTEALKIYLKILRESGSKKSAYVADRYSSRSRYLQIHNAAALLNETELESQALELLKSSTNDEEEKLIESGKAATRHETIEYTTLPIDVLNFFLELYSRAINLPSDSDEEKEIKIKKVRDSAHLLNDLFKDINNSFPLTLSDQAFETLAEQVKQDFDSLYKLSCKPMSILLNMNEAVPILPLTLFAAMQSDSADLPSFNTLDLIQIGQIAANAKPNISAGNRTILNLGIEALKKKLEILEQEGGSAANIDTCLSIVKIMYQLDESELALRAMQLAKLLEDSKEDKSIKSRNAASPSAEYTMLLIDDLTSHLKAYSRAINLPSDSDEQRQIKENRIKQVKHLLNNIFTDINNSFPLTLSDQTFQTLVEQVKQHDDKFTLLQHISTSQDINIGKLAPTIPLALFAAMQSDNTDLLLFNRLDLIQIGQIVANAKPNISASNRTILNLGIEALKKQLEILAKSRSGAISYVVDRSSCSNRCLLISTLANNLDEPELASQALDLAASFSN